MLNALWLGFFLTATVAALAQWLLAGNAQVFAAMVQALFAMAKLSVEVMVLLFGTLTLWLGFLRIAEEAGIVQALARWLAPLFAKLMPEIPRGHPALGLMTLNALVASDSILIPIQAEFYALEGLSQLVKTVQIVSRKLNPSLRILGILLTMFDGRTNLSLQVAEEVKTYFGSKVFKTVIPRTVKLSEAPSFGEPILTYAPKSKGAEAYLGLAKEIVLRRPSKKNTVLQ